MDDKELIKNLASLCAELSAKVRHMNEFNEYWRGRAEYLQKQVEIYVRYAEEIENAKS